MIHSREVKCPTLFTTHYTELTELAEQEENGKLCKNKKNIIK